MRISISESRTFDTCLRKWDYSSPNRQGLAPVMMSPALSFGIAIHAGLEAHYRAMQEAGQIPDVSVSVEAFLKSCSENMAQIRANMGTLPVEAEEKMYSQVELGEGMLRHYATWAEHRDTFEVLAVEPQFRVSLTGTDGVFVGRFDGVVRDSDGVWILEHKTFSQEPPPEFLVLDRQTTAYVWALQHIVNLGKAGVVPKGTEVLGVIYNGLRKKLPRRPPVLKSGGLSKDKAMDTTLEVYDARIAEQGLDASDYTAIRDVLKARGNLFFKREYLRKGPAELDGFGRDLRRIYRRMSTTTEIYPSPSWDCLWSCDFRDLCMAEQVGADHEDLRRIRYRKASSKGAVY